MIEAPLPLICDDDSRTQRATSTWPLELIYAKRYTINHITLRDMPHIDESRIGLTGSPTRVRKVYQPPLRGKVEMLSSVDEGAKKSCSNWRTTSNLKVRTHLLVPK